MANHAIIFLTKFDILYIPCRFRWRGIIVPGGLIAVSTAVTAFIIGYWDLDPLSSLRIGQQQTVEQ